MRNRSVRRLFVPSVLLAAFLVACAPAAQSVDAGAVTCADVDCGQHGRCIVDNRRPVCFCEPGFSRTDAGCVQKVEDPCAANPCAPFTQSCVADAGVAICLCHDGPTLADGGCPAPPACTPNPCTAPNRDVCTDVQGTAVCTCRSGYGLDGGHCEPLPIPDDHGDTAATATAITPGGAPSLGLLADAGDVDVFAFASAGATYYGLGCRTLSGSASCAVEVRGPDAGLLLGATGLTVEKYFWVPTAGEVSVAVRPAVPNFSSGRFDLTVVEIGPDDHGDDAGTATVVSAGRASARFEHGADVDVFAFDPVVGRIYATNCPNPAQATWCRARWMFADGGNLLASFQRNWLATDAGRVYLEVKPYNASHTGDYLFDVYDLGLDDHPNVMGPGVATFHPPDGGGAGWMQYQGDRDVFVAALADGEDYYLELTSLLAGPSAIISASDGGLVTGGRRDYFTTPVNGGPYTLTVLSSTEASSYNVWVERIPPDDHVATGTIAVGAAPISAVWEVIYDTDSFSFSTDAGDCYRITCTPNVPGDSCTVQASDPNGTYGASAAGRPAVLGIEAMDGGVWTAHAREGLGLRNNVAYSLKVENVGPDDFGDAYDASTPVALPADGGAGFQYTWDFDAFSFASVAGQTHRASCQADFGACAVGIADARYQAVTSNVANPAVVTFVGDGGTYHVRFWSSDVKPYRWDLR